MGVGGVGPRIGGGLVRLAGRQVAWERSERDVSHPVIPAPARLDPGHGGNVFRPGMRIISSADQVAPIVERFCTGYNGMAAIWRPGPRLF
jgi:hypothetical protein